MKTKMGKFPSKNPNPVFSVGKNGTILYSNEASEPLLNAWDTRVGEKIPPYIENVVQRVISRNSSEKTEVKAESRIYSLSFHPLPEEECINIYGFDISDRKEFEEKLRESEKRYHLLFENMLDGYAYCRMLYDGCGHPVDFIFLDTNIAFERLTGLREVNGKRATEAIPGIKEAHPELFDIYGKVALTGQPERFDIEFKPLGIWLSISVYSTEREHFVAVFDNITERKKADDALRQSIETARQRAEELEKLMDMVPAGIWISEDPECRSIIGNRAAGEMYETASGRDVSAGTTGGKVLNTERRWLKDSRELKPEDLPMQVAASKGVEVLDYEMDALLPSGRQITMFGNARPLFDDKGQVRGCIAVYMDITERKRAEEALRESEARFRSYFEMPLVGILITSLDKGVISVNDKFCTLVGYSADELKGTTWDKITHPEDLARNVEQFNRVLAGEIDSFTMEKRFIHKNGNSIPTILSVGCVRHLDHTVNCLVTTVQDITERKKMEDALRKANDSLEEKVKERTAELEKAYNSLKESEVRLAEAQELAHIGSWERNFAINKLHWSDEMFRIFGLKPQEFEVNYGLFLNYVHPDDRDSVENAFKEALKGKPFNTDFRTILAHGDERTVHGKGGVIFDDNNNPVRIRGTTQDITERRKAEEKIQYLANVVGSSTDAIVTVSLDSIVTSWNKGAEQIFGYAADEILGKKVSILEPENLKGDIKQFVEQVKTGKKIDHYESSRLKKDGTIINISGTLFPVLDTSGKLVAISVIARDITERKRTEETLRNFEIAQKREIHHRIKNNLQVIYSFLDLQAEKLKNRKNISDSEIQTAFKQSMDRILSIALIHEELYKGKNNESLNFSQYIKEFAENLILTYKLESNVSYNFDLEENIFLDMDTAIPLGIIINELVTNSFKYAFSSRDKGEIRIKLHREEGESKIKDGKSTTFILSVADNGVGIPEDLEIEDLNSLGLQLVTTLVEQLDGELELKRDNGTEFTIRFTLPENNNKES